jgi:hypothetical protein
LLDGTVAIQPRSASMELCLKGDAAGVWLERCVAGELTQKWFIDPDACMPD